MASTTILWERDSSLAERRPITGVRGCDHKETPNELIAALSRDMGHPNQLHEFVFGLGQPFGPVDGLLNPETQCRSRTHRRRELHRRLRPRAAG